MDVQEANRNFSDSSTEAEIMSFDAEVWNG